MPVSRLPQVSKDELEAEKRKEQIAQMRVYYAELRRLDNVAFRIRTANRTDCGERIAAQIGLFAGTPQSLPHKYRSHANEALNLSWARPTVISVADASPAAQAGIVAGDEIIALNGELIPVTGTAAWIDHWLERNGTAPVRANIRRAGDDRAIEIAPVMGCAIPIYYFTNDQTNAYTDGERIVIHSTILALAKTDAQLALIIGHELAHANLGHLKKQEINAFLGTLGGVAVDAGFALGGIATGGVFTRHFRKAGARAYSIGFEREADYVGAYYAARAGFDLTGAEEVWRAFSLAQPDSIRFATTHPTAPERFVQMQKVIAEIADKQRRHIPLVPDLKAAHADAEPASGSEQQIH